MSWYYGRFGSDKINEYMVNNRTENYDENMKKVGNEYMRKFGTFNLDDIQMKQILDKRKIKSHQDMEATQYPNSENTRTQSRIRRQSVDYLKQLKEKRRSSLFDIERRKYLNKSLDLPKSTTANETNVHK